MLSIFQGYVHHLQQGITICLLTTNQGQVLRTYRPEPSLNLISTGETTTRGGDRYEKNNRGMGTN